MEAKAPGIAFSQRWAYSAAFEGVPNATTFELSPRVEKAVDQIGRVAEI
jgi:hypothetical protein